MYIAHETHCMCFSIYCRFLLLPQPLPVTTHPLPPLQSTSQYTDICSISMSWTLLLCRDGADMHIINIIKWHMYSAPEFLFDCSPLFSHSLSLYHVDQSCSASEANLRFTMHTNTALLCFSVLSTITPTCFVFTLVYNTAAIKYIHFLPILIFRKSSDQLPPTEEEFSFVEQPSDDFFSFPSSLSHPFSPSPSLLLTPSSLLPSLVSFPSSQKTYS